MADDILAAIIADDEHAPFPEPGKMIRCFLRDGQVIDGTVARVWLDLDIVRIDVRPSSLRTEGSQLVKQTAVFRVTPAEGDSWAAL